MKELYEGVLKSLAEDLKAGILAPKDKIGLLRVLAPLQELTKAQQLTLFKDEEPVENVMQHLSQETKDRIIKELQEKMPHKFSSI